MAVLGQICAILGQIWTNMDGGGSRFGIRLHRKFGKCATKTQPTPQYSTRIQRQAAPPALRPSRLGVMRWRPLHVSTQSTHVSTQSTPCEPVVARSHALATRSRSFQPDCLS